MDKSSLGEQELELLRWIADNGPVSAPSAAADYGAPRGLAKTTVPTMMERLRAKDYLTRTKRSGIYEYSAAVSKSDLLRDLVRDFVERALGGASSPLVAYLAEKRGLTRDELATLERSVEEMERQEKTHSPDSQPDAGEVAQ